MPSQDTASRPPGQKPQWSSCMFCPDRGPRWHVLFPSQQQHRILQKHVYLKNSFSSSTELWTLLRSLDGWPTAPRSLGDRLPGQRCHRQSPGPRPLLIVETHPVAFVSPSRRPQLQTSTLRGQPSAMATGLSLGSWGHRGDSDHLKTPPEEGAIPSENWARHRDPAFTPPLHSRGIGEESNFKETDHKMDSYTSYQLWGPLSAFKKSLCGMWWSSALDEPSVDNSSVWDLHPVNTTDWPESHEVTSEFDQVERAIKRPSPLAFSPPVKGLREMSLSLSLHCFSDWALSPTDQHYEDLCSLFQNHTP
ncbi:hypothetical protein J4Q44_G00171430 [Coregonus suidteri]|uniref:Uncharacterized protein n=1 Tax=Coregonus suidteri TaxID=861788 RepID=A0AAN8QP55_9TELE